MASATEAESTEKCPVCRDILKDPQILACEHKLCSHCLQQHISATATAENKFNCPSCRQECEVPDGVENAMTQSVEQPTNGGQVNESGASAAMCTNSDHGPATVFCSDCDELYCQSCASSHQVIKLTRDHSMKPLDKMSPDEIPQAKSTYNTCTEHEEQQLDILCKRCKTLICKTCALFKHKGHWRQEIVDAANEAKKILEYIVVETTEYITQQEDKLVDMRLTMEDQTNVETAKDAVKKAAQRMRDIIDSHETDMLLDLDRDQAETLSELKNLTKETENNKAIAIIFKNETERLCQFGNTFDHVMQTPMVQKQFIIRRTSLEQKIKLKLDISFRNLDDDSLKNMFGNENLELSSTVNTRSEIKLGKPLNQVPVKHEGGYRNKTGMVVLDDCLCLIKVQDLQLYDLISGHNKTSPIPGMTFPKGMALMKSVARTVVIADSKKYSGKLHFVKILPDLNIAQHRVQSIPLIPSMVTVDSQTGQLLIGCNRSYPPHFIICDEDGNVQRQVTLTDVPEYENAWQGCLCVTGNTHGHCAIVRVANSKSFVQFVNQEGTCTHRYGERCNEGIGGAHHMVQDSKGRLIVVDCDNHRLHLLDRDGHFINFLLTKEDGIHNPQCVFLDETYSRLYVAHGEYGSLEVRVYIWLPTPGDVQTTNLSLKLNLGQF